MQTLRFTTPCDPAAQHQASKEQRRCLRFWYGRHIAKICHNSHFYWTVVVRPRTCSGKWRHHHVAAEHSFVEMGNAPSVVPYRRSVKWYQKAMVCCHCIWPVEEQPLAASPGEVSDLT